LAIVAAVVSSIAAVLFAALYHPRPLHAALLLLAGIGGGLSLLLATLLQILRRFALSQICSLLWRVALLAAVLGLLFLARLEPGSLFFLVTASVWFQVGLSWILLASRLSGKEPVSLRPMVRPALAFFALHLSALLTQRLDALFLPRLLDLASLGVYSAVTSIALTGFQMVGVAVGQVLNPRFASGEGVDIPRLLRWLLIGGGFASLMLVWLGPNLVGLVFGPRYEGDHRLLFALLAFTGAFQVLYAIPSSKIGIRGSQRILDSFVWWSFASVAVDVVLLLVLVPAWGLAGAAAATAIAWLFRTVTAWLFSRR
jgi:O-antigen/teichoic acid export membrane protein